MKRLVFICIIISSCSNNSGNKIEPKHVEKLAMDFMKTTVIPQMKEPKPYDIVGAEVVTKTAADNINDYRFTYEHLSRDHDDSAFNKKSLDSIIAVSKNPEAVVSVTVNVGYKTRYKRGDIVTDSIKLKYNPEKDNVTFWPF